MTTSNEILIVDPKFTNDDKIEADNICIIINKCINNMNELKRLSDQQKEMRILAKKIRDENKELYNDIIEFAANHAATNIKLSNGFNIKIDTVNKLEPLNDDMIKQGIIDQLKKFNEEDTIENIGFDKIKDGILKCIHDNRDKTKVPKTTIKFIKPKKSSNTTKKNKTK